jgi:hypothetical protein
LAAANVDKVHLEPNDCQRNMIRQRDDTYRKSPSVRTDRSWRTNQKPTLRVVSSSRKALTVRLPMRFLVNMPVVVAELFIPATMC